MEGGRDVAAGAAAAAMQGLRWSRRCGVEGGASGEETQESDGSSGGGGVELSLRLRTGDSSSVSSPAPVAAAAVVVAEEERLHAAAAAEVEARRNMTIFYNGRVCAVDVTEVQARAIISMANEEMISAAADNRRQQCHQRERHHLPDSASSSGSGAAMARCARAAHMRPAPPAAGSSSRQGFAAPVIDQVDAGLSMKRSLQRFLQKRKARTAGAVAPPYAGGLHAQAMRH
ncbi:unnamed protein product [Urochloa humidicola]